MKTILSMSATPVVFHITNQGRAAAILLSDRFELKPSDGTAAEEDISRGTYYLSTTRSKLGAFTKRTIYTNSAIFVLNGTELAHRYKIKPVDYWQSGDHKDARLRTESDEAEDRVLSKTPTIPARKYVLEVHAHVGEKGEQSERAAIMLKRICLLKKVPAFFYRSVEDLMRMDKRKSVELGLTLPKPPEDAYVPSREYEQAKMKERRHNSLRGWIELANVPVPTRHEEIWRKAKTLSRYAEMAYKRLYYDDAIISLKTDLHNAKSLPYGQPRGERESLDKLIALLRKRKQGLKEFVDSLRSKWYPN